MKPLPESVSIFKFVCARVCVYVELGIPVPLARLVIIFPEQREKIIIYYYFFFFLLLLLLLETTNLSLLKTYSQTISSRFGGATYTYTVETGARMLRAMEEVARNV